MFFVKVCERFGKFVNSCKNKKNSNWFSKNICTLLYTPRGISEDAKRAITIRYKIKQNGLINIGSENIPIIKHYAKLIKEKITKMPFADLFNENTILVPAPNHAPLGSKFAMWVPKFFANELVENGLGKNIEPCLERATSVKQSSKTSSKERPKAIEHYNSIKVVNQLMSLMKFL